MDTKIIAKVDDKKNSYYYEYLNESSPKDVNSTVSGINAPKEEIDEDDLFNKIKSINQNVNEHKDDYDPDAPIVDENIILQTQREEELKNKQNEERYKKEQEEKAAREKDAEIERLKAELENKNNKNNEKKSSIKDKFSGMLSAFTKKQDDNELEALVAEKEAKEEKQEVPKPVKEEKPHKSKEKVSKKDNMSVDELKYLAFHDENTGLLNKQALTEFTKKHSEPFAALYTDILNLALTNETLGHSYGDKLIKNTAETLKKGFPPETVYRVGADEFVIILNGITSKDAVYRKINNLNAALNKLSDADDDITYSLSIGYALSEDKLPFQVIEEAKIKMEEEKKNYKDLHPTSINEEPTQMSEKSYNSMLSKPQQILKNEVTDNHVTVTDAKMRNILTQIKDKINDVECIFITSADFNTLLIYQDADVFIETVQELPSFDFSYIYVLYQGGPQYYGSDAYTKEVSHLFEDIAVALQSGKIRTPDDLKKIKGINIFQNIHTDMM